MAYVYAHIRLDSNTIFYIGIGKTVSRKLASSKRNPHWHNIVNKTKCCVKILHANIDWALACELEIFYIKKYGRKDLNLGSLVNMTDGGQGSTGRPISEKVRKAFNKTGVVHSNKTREKMSLTHKTRSTCKGWKWSEESKLKQSISCKGRVPWNKGKPWSQEIKDKISKIKKLKFKMAKIPQSEPQSPKPFISVPGLKITTLRNNNHISGFVVEHNGVTKQFNVVNHDIEAAFIKLEKFVK